MVKERSHLQDTHRRSSTPQNETDELMGMIWVASFLAEDDLPDEKLCKEHAWWGQPPFNDVSSAELGR